jgi:hypothetical protein
MYTAFKHIHALSAVLALLATLAWSALAWRGASATGPLAGRRKLAYVLNRALVGLAGLSGIAVTWAGPWREMLFPYLGLALFIAHGFAAGASKKALGSGQAGHLQVLLLFQVAALLAASALMAIKPF